MPREGNPADVTDANLRARLYHTPRNGWFGPDGYHVPPEPTADDIAFARLLLSDPCAYCGGRAGCIDHIDHAGHGWSNLTASCRECNVSKGQRTLTGFLLAKRLRSARDNITAQISLLKPPGRTWAA